MPIERAALRKQKKRKIDTRRLALFCLFALAALILPIHATLKNLNPSEPPPADSVFAAAQPTPVPTPTPAPIGNDPADSAPPGGASAQKVSAAPSPARAPWETAASVPTPAPTPVPRPENVVVTISAIGDCTIGFDEATGRQNRFDQVYLANGSDPAYFFSNVKDILAADDLTIANLETTLTTAKKKAADKAFCFRGDPAYVRILEEGSVEAVNIANNHIYDYLQQGFDDTVATLEGSAVRYFGYDKYRVIEVRGVRVGLAGFHIGAGGWSGKKKAVETAIAALNAEADLVILSFHWGIEGKYQPTGDQKSLARFAIDSGADLVLGHHPHTLQGVETYNGRTVVYSLGNFCFGGNRNPKDKDSIILRQSFEFDGESFALLLAREPEIIPVSVSSVTDRNDYRPTRLEGESAERALKKAAPVK
ncbi:MAG: CapA family protein [Clostridiales bacterium]|jgi:poly-gamma-glutamate synthesis protein (capsule biosynthesis protein)|nr:CapA family protein [Clostridiales bacterium]